MAPTYVTGQVSKGASSGASTTTSAFSSATTTGNLIVVSISTNGAANAVTSVTDTAGNTYAKVWSVANSSVTSDLWYAENITGGASQTVTVTVSTARATAVVAHEYSGISLTSSLDKSVTATGSSNAPASGNTPTTTVASEIVIGAVAMLGGATTFTVGSGYTNLNQQLAANVATAQESLVTTSTGTQSAAFGASATTIWACGCVTFKGAPDPIGKRVSTSQAVKRSYFY